MASRVVTTRCAGRAAIPRGRRWAARAANPRGSRQFTRSVRWRRRFGRGAVSGSGGPRRHVSSHRGPREIGLRAQRGSFRLRPDRGLRWDPHTRVRERTRRGFLTFASSRRPGRSSIPSRVRGVAQRAAEARRTGMDLDLNFGVPLCRPCPRGARFSSQRCYVAPPLAPAEGTVVPFRSDLLRPAYRCDRSP